MIRLICAVAFVGALPGCGLIDPDITDFDLSLPPKEFVVDTDQWEIQVQGDTFPAVDCSADPGVCSAGAQQLCSGGTCFASCGADDLCEVLVLMDLWTTVNLAVEKPELAEIEGQPIVSVTIDRVWFDVVENTMNIDAPELAVYVAPSNVMESGSPQATRVGTIPVIEAGQTVMDGQMEMVPDGEQRLKDYMKDYRTPFNLIVSGQKTVVAGDPVPMGRFRAVVNVRATAGI
ncbi:MAG: hypothetical protein D6689_12610 [Deltaproteobacteria bacterium]|nr:MAG: hypothetical protein D6689_12610 [Deltaproteobacteria bacterium]